MDPLPAFSFPPLSSSHRPLHGTARHFTFLFFSTFARRCRLLLGCVCARSCVLASGRLAGWLWVWRMACRQNKGVRKGRYNPINCLSGDLHPPHISFTGISWPRPALAPAARHARKHRHDIPVLHLRICHRWPLGHGMDSPVSTEYLTQVEKQHREIIRQLSENNDKRAPRPDVLGGTFPVITTICALLVPVAILLILSRLGQTNTGIFPCLCLER